MPTILAQLDAHFRAAIKAAFGIDADPILAVSQNDKFGDYQSNAAMGLAKLAKSNPRAVAEQIKSKLDLGEMASEISIAGPGFINVKLAPAWLAKQIQSLSTDDRLGCPLSSSRQTVVVDYSGPNIAKEMHVGHLRSTIIGDAIARVEEFRGDKVVRQNHIGDWGTQFGMLIQRKLELGAGVGEIDDLETEYRQAKQRFDADPVFATAAKQRVVELQAGAEQVRKIWSLIVDETRRHYLPLYQNLGVGLEQSDERGESFYNPMLAEVVSDLSSKGIAVESEGATAVFADGPERSPLIIRKSDGGYLYGTTDLAAIRYRVDTLHADRIIYVHDSRQAQHFAQVFWTANKANWTRNGEVKLEYSPFGTMLGEDGKPFKSRSGDLIKLKDLLSEAEDRATQIVNAKDAERVARAKEKDEDVEPLSETQLYTIAHAVGIGAVKYADLSKDRISDYVFSWEKMMAMDGNTAPYLQYAHARIKSIFRRAKERGIAFAPTSVVYDSHFETALIKHALRLGEVIDLVARELKPHHLCTYLYDLATKFSGFFENCPVIQSEEPVRSSRLLLCDVTAKTLALGLDLLGIEHPEQM